MKISRAGVITLTCLMALGGALVAWRLRTPPHIDLEACTGLLGRPLRVGIVPWPGYAGGIMANDGFAPKQASIFYQQHNLCVEFLPVTDDDVRDLMFKRGGRDGLDVVWSTVDYWSYQLPNNKLKARAIMQVDWSHGGDAVVAAGDIRSLADLVHKRIALIVHTPSRWLLEQLLITANFNDSQRGKIVANLVQEKSPDEVIQDFANKKVDVAVLWEPYVTKAQKLRVGSRVLFDTSKPETSKQIADIMVAREHFIREHPDVIEAFIAGWMDGTVEASRSRTKVVDLLMSNEKEFGSRAMAEKSLTQVRWAGLIENNEMFALDGGLRPAKFDTIFADASRLWVKRGEIASAMDTASAKDDRFIRRIFHRRFPDGFRMDPGAESVLPKGSDPAVAP